ncbi:MAG: FapA family protein, partial [Oscillospiraceae bacterium]
MIENGTKTVDEQNIAEPIIHIRVTPDKMQAFLSVGIPENCRQVTVDDLLKTLERAGITFGIIQKELERRCSLQSFFSEILCAEGEQPVKGKDATMSYHFELNPVLKPRERADGGADFHDMGIIQGVEKDQVLCSRTMPVPGKDGMNVFGIVVPFKPGAEKKFNNGQNTYISEDLLTLCSSIDGCINFHNNIVAIDDTFTVRGNINTATGDIVFAGNVIVTGDVSEGFRIHAGKDVTVQGMVEGATIWAKGNITITQGMNGMNLGKLYAGGDIKSRYFQNTKVMCQGNIVADYYLNGEIIAGGAII